VKAGWETKTLGEVCTFLNGLWKGQCAPLVITKVIRNTNFTKDGTLDLSDVAQIDVEIRQLEKRRLEYGDIILEKSGGGPKQPVGRVVLFDLKGKDFSFSNFTSLLRVIDPLILDFKFLHRFLFWTHLSGQTEKMQSHSTGIRNLSLSSYKSIQVPIPPLPEQHRIVKILDEAFENIATAKANAEKNLQNARALFESHLQSIFNQTGDDWINNRIQDVCQIRPPKSEARGIVQSFEHVSFVPMEDLCIGEKYARASKTRPLSEVDGSYTYFAEGDVLLAKITPCFENGKLGIARNLERGIGFGSSEFIVFRPNSLLCNEWLYYFLRRERFRLEGAAQMAGAVGQKRVIKEFIENCLIPVPPISEQRRLVETLDSLVTETRRLESIYQAKIAALDELKKSLLHQAFNGDL